MTTYSNLKSLLLTGFLLCSVTIFNTSCKETPKEKDPEEVAEDMNKPKDDATKERDERFMVEAAEISMEEVRLGQLAQQKGTHADVKALGKMMEDAHTQGLADVTGLAGKKSIAIPTAPTDNNQNAYDRLNEKAAGMEFDKAYCNMMVEGHKTAINKYESAAKECTDPDIVAWANGALPGLRTHLSHAEACEAKLKDMK